MLYHLLRQKVHSQQTVNNSTEEQSEKLAFQTALCAICLCRLSGRTF